MRSELSLDLSSPTTMPLESRVYEFKQDPQKMDAMTKFVDDVLIKAQEEAEKKNELNYKTQQGNGSREGNLFVGLKRGRIVNRARGYVLRFFEAICNCTNTTIPTPSRTRSAPPPSTNKSSSSSSKAPKY